MSVQLTINDQQLVAREGQTVLEAAREHGIVIPTLCHHPDLSPVGSCRLCLVEVEGVRGEPAACTLPVSQGMVVHTETPALRAGRKAILEMLLRDYHDAGYTAPDRPETEFMGWVRHYGAQAPSDGPPPRYAVDADPNPFVWVDFNKCILCTRCVRACAEVQGRFVWGVGERGHDARIIAGADTTMLDARCESCGACAAYCPTGALDDRMSVEYGRPDRLVTTTCTYCGVGCQFDLNLKDGRIIRVTSNPDASVNGLALCVKGRYGWDFVHHPDRLTKPRVRRYLLEGDACARPAAGRGEWVETDWETALDITARRLEAARRETGPDSVGVLASAKCTNEENYLMQKFARQVLGTHNVDHCARLCHASTVAGLAMCYGSGAMSNTMQDVAEQARAILLIGSNTTEQHPVFGTRLRQAVLRRGVQLVVADPRRIDLTEFAALHLRQRPGTDVALINGLMNLILENGWQDEQFIAERCEGYDEFKAVVEHYGPARVAEITGVPEPDLRRAAELLAQNKPMAVIWAMGITQHTTGVMNVLSLGNLQMLLGNMGVPGGGVNPLRGQNNVQGACDMGALPNVFPGYQAVTDAKAREKFAAAWRLAGRGDQPAAPTDAAPLFGEKPGLTVTEMIPLAGDGNPGPSSTLGLRPKVEDRGQALSDGVDPYLGRGLRGVHALYILGEDPVLTDPDSNHVRECLEACEFVVLQEIFPSETAAYADVLLPGVSFAEKDGTFTNTERRVQRVRRAVEPPGEARPDWAITADLARRLLDLQGRRPAGPSSTPPQALTGPKGLWVGLRPDRIENSTGRVEDRGQAGWDYASPAAIMDEIAALTPSYAGVDYARLDRGETLHWPVKGPDHPGTPILHIGQFTRGKGKFHAIDHLPARELPDAEYPTVLTTGRVLYHWHGGEMTRRAKGLLEVYPETLVEINPEDALKIGLNGSAEEAAPWVRVVSRRGEMVARAVITHRVSPGLVFANFHFPGKQNVNNVTIAALDPVAKIPEYKVCAVRLERVDGPEA